MNCLIIDDEEMSRKMVRHFVDQTESLKVVGECDNALEAASMLQKDSVDLLFLDIEMPDMSGYELLKSLNKMPEVILVTAKTEHAAEAFDYDVADYLVKPLKYERFLKAVGKAKERLEQRSGSNATGSNPQELYVRSDSKIIRINFEDILYVEALADYIMIFTPANKYIVHSTMKGFQKRLPEDRFVRVHRSYIINTEKIEAIDNLSIVISKKHIPIGASYKEGFMKRLNLL